MNEKLRKLNRFMEARSAAAVFLIGLAATVSVGVIDHLTGSEISFVIFYIPAVSLPAWYGRRSSAVITSVIAAVAWGIADISSGHQYSHKAIVYWNASARFLTFLTVSVLLSSLRVRLRMAEDAASVDFLTGALNSRSFLFRLTGEIDRFRRYGRHFTIAYVDLDNFKAVNDTRGHAEGDRLLRKVAETMKANVRRTDSVARLGGDEFALLFAETGFKAASEAMAKVVASLREEMGRGKWPVSQSIGMVTYESSPEDTRQAIKIADDLMYSVKRAGKNSVAHIIWDGRERKK